MKEMRKRKKQRDEMKKQTKGMETSTRNRMSK